MAPEDSTFSEAAWTAIACAFKLSPMELRVVKGVFVGKTEKGIAFALGISVHTVHTYMARIRRKMGVNDRCELVIRIFQSSVAK